MIDRLFFLWPEIALFATTCVVMVLGLSKTRSRRELCAVVSALGLAAAGALAWLSTPSPDYVEATSAGQALFPGVTSYVKLITAGMGLLLLLLAAGTVDRQEEASIAAGRRAFDPLRANRAEFYAFFLFSLTGLMLCASADDLIWLFLALELTSLPTYIMVTMSSGRNRAREAGVKYFFLGALGAAFFLYGFSLIYGGTGATNLNAIHASFAARGINGIAMAGILLSLVGLCFKIAAVPMHAYTADVYQGAAPSVSAFLAFVPKTAGFVAILLLVGTLGWTHGSGHSLPEPVRLMLWAVAVLTMTVGNVLAILQASAKRLLAYSSIAHSGYMLVGVIAGPGSGPHAGSFAQSGVAAVLSYLLIYGVMNAGAFAVLAAIERSAAPGDAEGEPREVETIEDLRGLCRDHPLLGWAMVACCLSLLGMPPLVGFFGKVPLFSAGIGAGEIALVVILGLNSAIAAYYYLRLAFTVYLEKGEAGAEAIRRAPFGTRGVAAGISLALVIALGVLGDAVMRMSEKAGLYREAARSAPPPLIRPIVPFSGATEPGAEASSAEPIAGGEAGN